MKIRNISMTLAAFVIVSMSVETIAMQPSISPASYIDDGSDRISRLTDLPPPTPIASPQISLIFTGDINLGRCVAKASIMAGDFTYPFRYVADKLRSADLTVGSLDGTISDKSHPMPCPDSTNLIGPARMVEGLQFAGFDLISAATNHIKDCGELGYDCDDRALLDTVENLAGAGIQPVGAGETLAESRLPAVVERKGVRFAFLAINQIDKRVWASAGNGGTAPLSPQSIDQIKADIASAKKIADVVIVLPQWGIEYASLPDQTQRTWAQEFLNAGAALVIGNGPHIVQPVEVFPNGVAYYALGNFVFDQGQSFRREGVVVEAIFNGAKLENWHLLPVQINYFTYQPRWAEGSDVERILGRATPLSQ